MIAPDEMDGELEVGWTSGRACRRGGSKGVWVGLSSTVAEEKTSSHEIQAKVAGRTKGKELKRDAGGVMDDAGRWMTDSRSAAVPVAFKVPTAVRLKRPQSLRKTLEARLVCLGRCGARGSLMALKGIYCEMLHKPPDERHR